MTKVFSAPATSVDGYITGPDPNPARSLGIGGEQLFDWYTDGDTPVPGYSRFRLSAASATVFEVLSVLEAPGVTHLTFSVLE